MILIQYNINLKNSVATLQTGAETGGRAGAWPPMSPKITLEI